MNLLTRTPSRFIPSSILIFALTLSGCGGGGGSSKTPDPTPSSSAVSASSIVSSSAVTSSAVTSSAVTSSAVTSSSVASTSSAISTSSVVSSSSSSAIPVSTTYNVNVNVPASLISQGVVSTWQQKLSQFFVPAAYADTPSDLAADNFAVVVVDLAGNVLERITLKPSDISKNPDGTWSIRVPGNPRLDCLIVADITKPIVLPVAGNINQSGLVFAPTTEENLDVGIASTAAFKTFIDELGGTGTFESLNIDPKDAAQVQVLQDLVDNIQENIENQTFTGFSTVEAAVTSIKTIVTDVVKQEVLNIKNPTQSTLVSAIQSEGGLHWYESDDDDDGSRKIYHGSLIGSDPMKKYVFNGAEFKEDLDEENRELLLSNGAWVLPSDIEKIKTLNADGSLVLQDTVALDDIVTVTAIQSVSLAGRKIVDMLSANIDTKDFAQSFMNPNAVFGAGANAYRIQASNSEEDYDHYRIWTSPGDKITGICPWSNGELASNYGGNCHRVFLRKANNQYVNGPREMAELISSNVTPSQDGSVVIDIQGISNGTIGVQLLNDEAKTARYYRYSNGNLQSAELLATATYSEFNLPGLTTDAAAIKLVIPPAVLAIHDFNRFDAQFFVKQNGAVRQGGLDLAEQNDDDDEGSLLLLNGTANTNIQSALSSYVSPLVGKWGNIESDVFTFTNNTFVHSKVSGPDNDPNCKAGTSTGNYGWNPNTFIMTVFILTDTMSPDPTDSCSIDTGIKWKPIEGGLEVTYQDDGKDVTFLAPKIVTE